MLKLDFRTLLKSCFSKRKSLRRTIRRRSGHRKTLASTQYLEDRTLLSAVSWTGLGGDSNWSNAGNWDSPGAPGANDTVTIGSGASVTLDTNVDVQDLIINGTLVGGIFDIQVSEDLSVGASGIFSSSGELIFDGTNDSAVVIDASATTTIENVTFAKTDSRRSISLTGDLDLAGDLTITGINGINGDALQVSGDIVTTDTSVSGTSTILLDGGTHDISGGGRLSVLEITAGTTANASSDFGTSSLIIGGTLNAAGQQVSVRDDLTIESTGDFSGSLKFDGTNDSTVVVDASATTAIANLTFAKTDSRRSISLTGDLDVAGDLTITGINGINGDALQVSGDIVTTDTSVSGTSTILLDGGTHDISGGGRLSVLEITAGTTANASSDFGTSSLIIGGTLNAAGQQVSVRDDLTIESTGDFSSSLKFDGTNDSTVVVDASATTAIANLTFAKTDSRRSISLTGDLDVAGDLTITGINGINGDALQVSGDIVTTDTSVSGTSTILLDGGTHDISGGGRLSVLEITAGTTANASSDFGTSSLIIGGTLNAAGQQVSVRDDLTIESTGDFSGSLKFDGTNDSTVVVDASATTAIANLTFAKTDSRRSISLTGDLDVAGDVTITGINGMYGGTINVGGDVSSSDSSVSGDLTLRLNGTHQVIGAGDVPVLEIVNGTTQLVGDVNAQSVHVLGGGVLEADGSATLGIALEFIVAGGTFHHNGGTVSFNENDNSTIDIGNTDLHNLKLDKSDSRRNLTIVGPALDVGGDLEIKRINSILGTGQINVAGDVTTSDTTVNGGTIVMDGSNNATLTATVAGAEVPDLIIQKGSYSTVTVEGDVQVDGDLTLISLRGIDGPGQILVNHDVTTSDTSVGGNGTIVMNGTGTLSATQDGADIPSLVIDTAGTVTIDPAHIVAVTGDWTEVSGTVVTTGSTVQFEGPTTVNAATAFDNVNLRMGSYDTLHAVDLDVDGNLYLISLRGIDGTVTVGGDVTTRDTSVIGGTIVMDGTGTLSSEVDAGDVPSLVITGDVTIDPTNTIAVTGDWTQTSGTVHTAGSTVQFEGPTTVNAATAFDNVNLRMGSYDTLHATSLDVDGDLYLISLRGIDGTVTVGGDVTTRDTSVIGGTIVMDGTGTLSSEVDAGDVPSLVIDTAGVVTIAGGNTIAVTGDWTEVSGTVITAGSTVQFEGPTTVNAATAFDNVNLRMGSYDTLHATSLDVDGNLYLISLRGIDGTVTVGGDVTTRDTSVIGGTIVMDGTGTLSSEVDAGDVPSLVIDTAGVVTIAGGNTIAVTGDWTEVSGTVITAGSTVQFEGPTTVNAATAFDNVNLRMGSYDTLHATSLDVDGNLYLISLRGIDGTVTVGGDVTTRDTSVIGGTIVMDGTGSLAAEVDGADVPNLVINTNGVITIDPAHIVAVTGDWTQVHGTVHTAGSTVQFEGPTTVDAATAFNDVILRMGSYDTLTVIDMDVDGDLMLHSLRDINGANITVAGDVITSDTSVTGNSTIVMDGFDATLQATVNGADLPNLEIAKWSGEVITVLGDVQVNGDLTLTGMKNLNGPGRILVKGDLNLHDSNIGGSGTIVMNGTGSVRALVDYADLPSLVIDTSHTITLDPGHIISVTGNWDLVSGNVVTTGSTVQFQGNTNVDSAIAFENVLLSMESGDILNANDLYVNGDLTINGLNAINGNIYVNGNVTTGDTTVGGSGTIVMTGTGTIAATVDGADLPSLEINTAGTITIDAGHILSITGNWTEIAGTVITTGSTVQFQGNTTVDAASAFNNVLLNMESADILFLSQDMDINGNLTINNLSQIQGARFLLAGNLDVNDTGVYGSPKFVLDGTGAIQTIEAAGTNSLGHASFEILDSKVGDDAQLISDVDALDVVFANVGVDGGATLDQNGFLLNGV